MILLDNSVIFTGLPSIRAGLDLSTTELSWVQDAYTLVFGGLLLLGARAGDIVGRRRLFVVGLAIFGAASGADRCWPRPAGGSSPPGRCRASAPRSSPRPRWR